MGLFLGLFGRRKFVALCHVLVTDAFPSKTVVAMRGKVFALFQAYYFSGSWVLCGAIPVAPPGAARASCRGNCSEA